MSQSKPAKRVLTTKVDKLPSQTFKEIATTFTFILKDYLYLLDHILFQSNNSLEKVRQIGRIIKYLQICFKQINTDIFPKLPNQLVRFLFRIQAILFGITRPYIPIEEYTEIQYSHPTKQLSTLALYVKYHLKIRSDPTKPIHPLPVVFGRETRSKFSLSIQAEYQDMLQTVELLCD